LSVAITNTVSSHAGGNTKHIRYRQDSLKYSTVRQDSVQHIPASTSANIVPSNPVVSNYTPIDGTDNILELTLSEFCRLGFVRGDTSLVYGNLSPDSLWVGEKYWFRKSGDGFSMGIGTYYDKRKIKQITQNDFYPVFSTPRYLPKGISYLPYNYKNISRIKGDKYEAAKDDTLKAEKVRDFKIMNDTLVPATVIPNRGTQFGDSILSNEVSEKIYWFNPTLSFYALLPERFHDKTVHFYDSTKAIKRRIADRVDLVKYDSPSMDLNTDPLNLSNQELQKLGFQFKNSGMSYNNIVYLYANKKRYGNGVMGGSPPIADFYPFYISTIEGELPFIYQITIPKKVTDNIKKTNDTSSYEIGGLAKDFIKNTNRLVPVLINMKPYLPPEQLKYLGNGLIFWFTPTEAFFDSLPKPIGNEIRTEYHALLTKDNPAILPAQKNQVVTSCKYFEECRVTYDGLTEMTVAPNPTSDALTVKVTFPKPTTCFIQLFDMRGRFIKTLKAPELVDIGTYQFAVSLGGLPASIYILIIRDNKSNSKIQRVVKI
jgi:hypothetical protein